MSDPIDFETIQQTAEVVMHMVDNDRPRDELLEKIDAAISSEFKPDTATQALPWVKKRFYGLTDIADSRNTGVRTFDTLMPNVEIQPLNSEQREYDRTDMAEQALSWEFERMNRIGQKNIHSQILEDAMSYHAVALQTEYLPFKFKNVTKDGRIRAMLRSRSFNWLRHHPRTVHARYSDYGLESVAKVSNYSAQSLIDRFGRDNEGVRKLLADREDNSPVSLLRGIYTLVDFTDWKDRKIWAVPAGTLEAGQTRLPSSSSLFIASSMYVFQNEPHELPFLPWVVVDKGNPIWESVLQSGTWDNLQYMNLIRFAKAIEMSTRSTLVIKTPDGTLRNVWIDFTNPSNAIVTPLDGTIVDNLQPAPIDPQLETMFQDASAKLASSTVSHVLRDISKFSNAPFSTVNQMVQMALGQLSRAKNAAADAESLAFIQCFEWIDHSQIPYLAYRPEGKDSKTDGGAYRGRGEQITIRPGAAPSQKEFDKMTPEEHAALERTVYFDLEAIYLKVKLQANDSTDEQARMNVEINAVEKLGKSRQMAWESLGWNNYNLSQNQRMNETFIEAEMQNEIMRESQQVKDEMMQEAMKQVQQKMKQQMTQASENSQMNGGSQPTAEGQDMRAGSNPFSRQAPGMNREQVTGQAADGGQVVQ